MTVPVTSALVVFTWSRTAAVNDRLLRLGAVISSPATTVPATPAGVISSAAFCTRTVANVVLPSPRARLASVMTKLSVVPFLAKPNVPTSR